MEVKKEAIDQANPLLKGTLFETFVSTKVGDSSTVKLDGDEYSLLNQLVCANTDTIADRCCVKQEQLVASHIISLIKLGADANDIMKLIKKSPYMPFILNQIAPYIHFTHENAALMSNNGIDIDSLVNVKCILCIEPNFLTFCI